MSLTQCYPGSLHMSFTNELFFMSLSQQLDDDDDRMRQERALALDRRPKSLLYVLDLWEVIQEDCHNCHNTIII